MWLSDCVEGVIWEAVCASVTFLQLGPTFRSLHHLPVRIQSNQFNNKFIIWGEALMIQSAPKGFLPEHCCIRHQVFSTQTPPLPAPPPGYFQWKPRIASYLSASNSFHIWTLGLQFNLHHILTSEYHPESKTHVNCGVKQWFLRLHTYMHCVHVDWVLMPWNTRYRHLYATVWALGIKQGPPARAPSAPSSWHQSWTDLRSALKQTRMEDNSGFRVR